MSSYLNIYVKERSKPAIHAFWFSRNHPIYQAVHDNISVKYINELECKEWYKYRSDQFGNEFNQEVYDSLPTEDEMLETQATKLTSEKVESIISSVHKELESAIESKARNCEPNKIKVAIYEALDKYFPEKNIEIPEESEDNEADWDEYIDDLKLAINQLYLFTGINPNIEFYCYID